MRSVFEHEVRLTELFVKLVASDQRASTPALDMQTLKAEHTTCARNSSRLATALPLVPAVACAILPSLSVASLTGEGSDFVTTQ